MYFGKKCMNLARHGNVIFYVQCSKQDSRTAKPALCRLLNCIWPCKYESNTIGYETAQNFFRTTVGCTYDTISLVRMTMSTTCLSAACGDVIFRIVKANTRNSRICNSRWLHSNSMLLHETDGDFRDFREEIQVWKTFLWIHPFGNAQCVEEVDLQWPPPFLAFYRRTVVSKQLIK